MNDLLAKKLNHLIDKKLSSFQPIVDLTIKLDVERKKAVIGLDFILWAKEQK